MSPRKGFFIPFLLASGLALACLFVVFTLVRRDIVSRLDDELAEARLDFLVEGGFQHGFALAENALAGFESIRTVIDMGAQAEIDRHLQATAAIVPFESGRLVGTYHILHLDVLPETRNEWTVRIVVEAHLETRPDQPHRVLARRRAERVLPFSSH